MKTGVVGAKPAKATKEKLTQKSQSMEKDQSGLHVRFSPDQHQIKMKSLHEFT